MLDKKRLGELVKEVDPAEQLDEDVEDILLQVARDLGIIIKIIRIISIIKIFILRILSPTSLIDSG